MQCRGVAPSNYEFIFMIKIYCANFLHGVFGLYGYKGQKDHYKAIKRPNMKWKIAKKPLQGSKFDVVR